MFLACAQRLCGNCSLALPPTCFLKPQEGLGRAGGVVSSHVLVEYAIWHPPRLSTRHFLPAPAPEVKPGLGRGWGVAGGWPGSSQHPSSPALSPCHIKHTHTHGAALHSCPQEALSGQLPLLSQHPGLAAAPQNHACAHTRTRHTACTHARTHARGRCARLPGTAAAPHALFPQRCSLPALSLSSLAVFTTGSSVTSLATSATWHHAVLEATPSRPTGLPGGICGLDTLPLPLPLGRAHPQKRLSPSRVGPAGFCRQPS